ncbi:hypothetical protein NMYAN_210011 [Nitrosomonas nitrosa]|uniref:Uncharacterized protein n=1 Tax=Nitrosomonas nitrosa TaxID=52442 RepID=A0A8H9DA27_9PROT|nr:hypothetical protein NMYAN_210011 [Nitrosomonas nitrosa]
MGFDHSHRFCHLFSPNFQELRDIGARAAPTFLQNLPKKGGKGGEWGPNYPQ